MYLIKHGYGNSWYKNSVSDLIDNMFKLNLDSFNYESSNYQSNYDIKNNSKDYRIFLDLPGIEKKDINLNINDNKLTVDGKRAVDEGDNYLCKNRNSGNFCNSFNLPDNIDREKISAKFKNGVLEIIIPKLKSELKKISKILIS